jgi:hypothetical protein
MVNGPARTRKSSQCIEAPSPSRLPCVPTGSHGGDLRLGGAALARFSGRVMPAWEQGQAEPVTRRSGERKGHVSSMCVLLPVRG